MNAFTCSAMLMARRLDRDWVWFIRVMEARSAWLRAAEAALAQRERKECREQGRKDQSRSFSITCKAAENYYKMEGKQFTLRCQKNSQDSVRISDLELDSRLRPEANEQGPVSTVAPGNASFGALPDELKSILAAGIRRILCPMNDAMKQAFAKDGAVDGAAVIRGNHVSRWTNSSLGTRRQP